MIRRCIENRRNSPKIRFSPLFEAFEFFESIGIPNTYFLRNFLIILNKYVGCRIAEKTIEI